MVKYCLSFLFLFFSISSAQEVTFSGFISDSSNGESLIGTNIYLPNLHTGASTNQYGFFSISVPSGEYIVRISYVGYNSKEISISLFENKRIDFELTPQSVITEEIIITGEAEDRNIRSTEMGITNISIAELQKIPVLFGEQDIMKTIQLMPGISAANEGSSGFYVRGGGPDENLILLDEAPVYNATHFLGFFSVFNSDAINSAKLIKGNGPVEYGGRLSSVLDIKMKEGNRKNFGVTGGIGLISSRLALEGPFDNGNGSFFVSGRRTYADLIMKAVDPESFEQVDLFFYDINLKANYSIGERDQIFLSGYFGRDVLGVENEFGLNWGNTTATLRWNHIFNSRIFSNTSFIYSDFDYVVNIWSGGSKTDITSGIKDYNLRQNFYWSLNPLHQLTVGFDINHHTFIPGRISAEEEANLNSLNIQKKYGIESAIYAGHEWNIQSWFSVNYGLRFSMFNLIGPGSAYEFSGTGELLSQKQYERGNVIKTYSSLEPRLTINTRIDSISSVKLSYSKSSQYIHLISGSSTGGAPIDVWHPSTSIIKPGIADQISLGYFRNFDNNRYESSIEIYYKDLQNQVEYKDGADLLLNEFVESQLVFGKGQSYGVELFFKKKFSVLNGWAGYTLSRTEKEFEKINNGQKYPAKNDRTHDISLVLVYQPYERWTFSANWIFNTGQAVTFPSGKYIIDGQTVNYYTDRNAYRMPDYHRLDLSATYILGKSDRFESSLSFSLYNAYGQKNPYYIYFRENENDPTITEAVNVYMFTFFPSLSFNFKW